MNSAGSKRQFYEQLATMLSSGLPVAKICQCPHVFVGRSGAWIASVKRGTSRGGSFAESLFDAGRRGISVMEYRLLEAAERGGKLETGCRQLEAHFASLEQMLRVLRSRLSYPLLVMHVAVVAGAIPAIAAGTSATQALLVPLVSLWVLLGAMWLVGGALWRLAERNTAVDGLLLRLPFIGAFRRASVLAKWNAVFAMSLEAGLLISQSVQLAAASGGSPSLEAAFRPVEESLRGGSPLAPLLAKLPHIPQQMTSQIATGEAVGRLDQVAHHLAIAFQSASATAAERLGRWLGSLVFALAAAFAIRTIFGLWSRYFSILDRALDGGF